MSNTTFFLPPRLYDYLLSVSLREPEVLRRLRAETARDPKAHMQIAPEQGQFLAFLIRLMGARRVIEVGVYTGYSSLWMALALPEDGRLVACDINERWTSVARRYWAEAGVSEKVELQLAPALETLDGLLAEGQAGTFDFVFVDADKEPCLDYYERALCLLRRGGVVAFDNVLWSGSVADPSVKDRATAAIRALNDKLRHDPRIAPSLVPIGDGLTLAMKL
ncbi:MAG: class I SAM-dependent methyltransferase [Gammaproteobacteria bacterium]